MSDHQHIHYRTFLQNSQAIYNIFSKLSLPTNPLESQYLFRFRHI